MTKEYVVFDRRSTVQVGPLPSGQPHSLYRKDYKTMGFAQRAADRFNAFKHGPDFVGPGTYFACSREHYLAHVVKMVERTNFLSGEKFVEPSNTPYYCSPSSETYWST